MLIVAPDPRVDLETLARLRSAEGARALTLAGSLYGGDPLVAAGTVRAAGFDAGLAAAALSQVDLRRRAAAKFGPEADRMWFSRAGLEQATRPVVAAGRAARLAAAGASRVADLGCGIGADTIAFARAGLRVKAVEADPVTAELARSNVEALGLRADIVTADVTTVDLSDVDAAFADPARRDGARRVFDPAAYSPPWSYVVGLAQRVPSTVLKLAPGLDHALIPDGAEAEWVSVDHALVECALWFGPLATVTRRASVLVGGAVHELTGSGTAAAPVAGVRRYLFDPDPAVVRAHLVAEFAATVEGGLADPHIAYVFADQGRSTPYGRCFEVVGELRPGLKHLRTALRERGIGRLEIRKRGLAIEPDRLRHGLRLSGPHGATLVMARIGDRPAALLCQPYP